MDAAEEFCPVELHHIPLFCSRVGMPTQHSYTCHLFYVINCLANGLLSPSVPETNLNSPK